MPSKYLEDDDGNQSSSRLFLIFGGLVAPLLCLIVWAYSIYKTGIYSPPGWEVAGMSVVPGATKVGADFAKRRRPKKPEPQDEEELAGSPVDPELLEERGDA